MEQQTQRRLAVRLTKGKGDKTKNYNFLFFPFPFLFYYFVSIVSLVSLLFSLSTILLKNGAWHCLRAPEKLSHVDLLCVESVGKLIAHMLYRHWIYYTISMNMKVRNVSPTARLLCTITPSEMALNISLTALHNCCNGLTNTNTYSRAIKQTESAIYR